MHLVQLIIPLTSESITVSKMFIETLKQVNDKMSCSAITSVMSLHKSKQNEY